MYRLVGAGVVSCHCRLYSDFKLHSPAVVEVPFDDQAYFKKFCNTFLVPVVSEPSRLFAEGSNFTLRSQLKHDEKQ